MAIASADLADARKQGHRLKHIMFGYLLLVCCASENRN
jgi:hypothetical protein